MKIYFNRQPVSGPWGGGNKLLSSLVDSLNKAGHEVVFKLDQVGIDIIYCQDPRPNSNGEWYENFLNYKKTFGSKIIHRVGDVGSHSKPELTQLLKSVCRHSDYLIFTSNWAKDYIEYMDKNCAVIYNAPMQEFYQHM